MFPASFTALFDACVLYPAPLRDLLLQMAVSETFRARWTETIHDEWTRNLLANRPNLKAEAIENTVQAMNRAIEDCLIVGYEDLIPSLDLPDKDDRHILAAAIKGGADVIVTFNLKDFPKERLALYHIEPQHPDDFLMHLIDLYPDEVCLAARQIRARLTRPPKTCDEYLLDLARQKLPKTVQFLAARKDFF
jgi:predicted nucleic acid-binding protein